MRSFSVGRGSPANSAKLLASGAALFVLAAVLDGGLAVAALIVGVLCFGAGAIVLGRWPRRP